MAVVPASVLRVARGWDDQHTDLRVASDQVAEAPTSGFSPEVALVAADFLRAWTAHTGAAARLSEQQALDLRSVLAVWLRTDDAAEAHFRTMLPGWGTAWG